MGKKKKNGRTDLVALALKSDRCRHDGAGEAGQQ